jgi:hypothetical protein
MTSGGLRAKELFSLPEGDAILEWPCPMSPESYIEFCEWLALVKRKIERISQEMAGNG